ncbi:MAG: FHA domain-containing protein [Pleurocapsa sp.]
MITCPSCNHQNPEGSLQCENCYTPLPATTSCPNCGTSVQVDATFCGQCGFNLQAENPISETPAVEAVEETAVGSLPNISLDELSTSGAIPEMPLAEAEADILPETAMSSPISSPWDEEEEDLTIGQPKVMSNPEPTEMMNVTPPVPDLELGEDTTGMNPDMVNTMPWEAESPDLDSGMEGESSNLELDTDENTVETGFEIESENLATPGVFSFEEEVVSGTTVEPVSEPDPMETVSSEAVSNISGATQLQIQTASLLHLQSDTTIDIADHLDVVHIGKPNGQIPPDIDVAGFPDSEVVSRLHADIRIEGDAYYLEDVGSSNGTYVNHTPLVKGNRHRLRPGDRIALGKGDLVTFIFQIG